MLFQLKIILLCGVARDEIWASNWIYWKTAHIKSSRCLVAAFKGGFTFISVSELPLTSATSFTSRNCNSQLTQLKSRSKICYDRRSVGQSVLMSRTYLGPRPHLYYCQTVARELLMCGAFSDERTGVSFTTAVGPRQRSHSRTRVPHNSWPYTRNTVNPVGFEVLTPLVIMSSIFWDMSMCSPFKA
jgi:hypothetical protein